MVWHKTIGGGPIKVVVIHGWFWDHRVFTPIFDCLDGNRYTFAFIDIRGYGNSRSVSGKYTIGEVAADAIALVGLLATARVFLALAAMDIGTAFGTLGARREMMVGFLAEPALLMIIFVASMISATTALPAITENLATQTLGLYPSLAFTAVAFILVLLAENARIPIDNPATHLELTMIHEAMVLEYSARHLALMEWAAALKLFNYACIGFALFIPWGISTRESGPIALLASIPLLGVKLAVTGAGLALIETVSAKLRVFRAPEFLGVAFLLAVLGLLVHLLLGA